MLHRAGCLLGMWGKLRACLSGFCRVGRVFEAHRLRSRQLFFGAKSGNEGNEPERRRGPRLGPPYFSFFFSAGRWRVATVFTPKALNSKAQGRAAHPGKRGVFLLYAESVVQPSVDIDGSDLAPGCARKASRPWAVEFNAFGVMQPRRPHHHSRLVLPRCRIRRLTPLGSPIPARFRSRPRRSALRPE